MYRICLPLLCVLTVIPSPILLAGPGTTMQPLSDGGAIVSVSSDYAHQGRAHLVTSLGADILSGSFVNELIGANTFYEAGYYGFGTISSVIEPGHIWGTPSGHTSLTHVTTFVHDTSADAGPQTGQIDRHATLVGQVIGGRGSFSDEFGVGIAFGTDLRSGAIATTWDPPPENTFNYTSSTL